MEHLLQRTALLYGTFAFGLLFALVVACVVIVASEIDRTIEADLRNVASTVPAIAALAHGSVFSERAAYIVERARRPGVEVSVRDTSMQQRNSVSVDLWRAWRASKAPGRLVAGFFIRDCMVRSSHRG